MKRGVKITVYSVLGSILLGFILSVLSNQTLKIIAVVPCNSKTHNSVVIPPFSLFAPVANDSSSSDVDKHTTISIIAREDSNMIDSPGTVLFQGKIFHKDTNIHSIKNLRSLPAKVKCSSLDSNAFVAFFRSTSFGKGTFALWAAWSVIYVSFLFFLLSEIISEDNTYRFNFCAVFGFIILVFLGLSTSFSIAAFPREKVTLMSLLFGRHNPLVSIRHIFSTFIEPLVRHIQLTVVKPFVTFFAPTKLASLNSFLSSFSNVNSSTFIVAIGAFGIILSMYILFGGAYYARGLLKTMLMLWIVLWTSIKWYDAISKVATAFLLSVASNVRTPTAGIVLFGFLLFVFLLFISVTISVIVAPSTISKHSAQKKEIEDILIDIASHVPSQITLACLVFSIVALKQWTSCDPRCLNNVLPYFPLNDAYPLQDSSLGGFFGGDGDVPVASALFRFFGFVLSPSMFSPPVQTLPPLPSSTPLSHSSVWGDPEFGITVPLLCGILTATQKIFAILANIKIIPAYPTNFSGWFKLICWVLIPFIIAGTSPLDEEVQYSIFSELKPVSPMGYVHAIPLFSHLILPKFIQRAISSFSGLNFSFIPIPNPGSYTILLLVWYLSKQTPARILKKRTKTLLLFVACGLYVCFPLYWSWGMWGGHTGQLFIERGQKGAPFGNVSFNSSDSLPVLTKIVPELTVSLAVTAESFAKTPYLFNGTAAESGATGGFVNTTIPVSAGLGEAVTFLGGGSWRMSLMENWGESKPETPPKTAEKGSKKKEIPEETKQEKQAEKESGSKKGGKKSKKREMSEEEIKAMAERMNNKTKPRTTTVRQPEELFRCYTVTGVIVLICFLSLLPGFCSVNPSLTIEQMMMLRANSDPTALAESMADEPEPDPRDEADERFASELYGTLKLIVQIFVWCTVAVSVISMSVSLILEERYRNSDLSVSSHTTTIKFLWIPFLPSLSAKPEGNRIWLAVGILIQLFISFFFSSASPPPSWIHLGTSPPKQNKHVHMNAATSASTNTQGTQPQIQNIASKAKQQPKSLPKRQSSSSSASASTSSTSSSSSSSRSTTTPLASAKQPSAIETTLSNIPILGSLFSSNSSRFAKMKKDADDYYKEHYPEQYEREQNFEKELQMALEENKRKNEQKMKRAEEEKRKNERLKRSLEKANLKKENGGKSQKKGKGRKTSVTNNSPSLEDENNKSKIE